MVVPDVVCVDVQWGFGDNELVCGVEGERGSFGGEGVADATNVAGST